MYEQEISFIAQTMSRSRWRAPAQNAVVKTDRQFTRMLTELLEDLAGKGFSDWGQPVVPPKKDYYDPRITILSQDGTVELSLYNLHSRIAPKHIAYRITDVATGHALLLGTYTGSLRMTDLRTMVSQYDGVTWCERHFLGQLKVDTYNNQLQVGPGVIEKQVVAALAIMKDIGITDTKHALLPGAGSDISYTTMRPWLVGMYGTMPVAVSIDYKYYFCMQFYAIDITGICNLDFGFVKVDEDGKFEKNLDIGKLLGGGNRVQR